MQENPSWYISPDAHLNKIVEQKAPKKGKPPMTETRTAADLQLHCLGHVERLITMGQRVGLPALHWNIDSDGDNITGIVPAGPNQQHGLDAWGMFLNAHISDDDARQEVRGIDGCPDCVVWIAPEEAEEAEDDE